MMTTAGRWSWGGLVGVKESLKEVKFLAEEIKICVRPGIGFIIGDNE